MRSSLRFIPVFVLAAIILIASIAATPAQLARPSQPIVTAIDNPGELQVSWNHIPGAQHYTVGYASPDEMDRMAAAGRNRLDAFYYATIGAENTSHTFTGLEPETVYWVTVGAQTERFGATDLVWAQQHAVATTAGQHGDGFCPITGLPLGDEGYLSVGSSTTNSYGDVFTLDSVTKQLTRHSFGSDLSPNNGRQFIKVCGAIKVGAFIGYVSAAYDYNVDTDAGIGFRQVDSSVTDWADVGLLGTGVSASACEIWDIPANAKTVIVAINNGQNSPGLYQIDLTKQNAPIQTTPEPTPTPTPTQTPNPTPAPVAVTPTPDASGWRSPTLAELAELEQLMLELTNAERAKHGAPPVVLGDNPSPKIHAEQGLANCYSSHWDLWGFKPLYRYALTGGDQYTAENGSGIDYCPKASDNIRINQPQNWENNVRDAVAGWISSPGHHRNLIDPRHSVMHAGIAIGRYDNNSNMVQVFSGNYVDWTSSPSITDSTLAATGQMSDAFYDEDDNYVLTTIEYHPPTNRLTPGQLAGTYCLEPDIRVGALLTPLQPGWYYTDENGQRFTDYVKFQQENVQCVNPYELPADRQPPVSWADAHAHYTAAVSQSNAMPDQVSDAYKVVSDLLDISSDGREFSIRADLSPILSHYGPGIYTVTIWATTPDGEPNPVAEYPIWWQTMPTSGHPY